MNVVEPILFQAKHDPPAPALCAPGTRIGIVSYARLARFINNVGRRAFSMGISPRQIVAIQVKDHIFHAVLALGLMHIGVPTVSIGSALPHRLRVNALLTDEPFSSGDASRAKVIAADISWLAGEQAGPIDERHVYRGSGDDICRIALTSGSTGEAKAVGFTHNNQLARLACYNYVFGRTFPERSRFFRDYGFGSSGGFRHMLYVLWRGGTMFFPGASPMETLQSFELYKVQGLIASPGALSGYLKFYEANSDFRCGYHFGWEPVDDSLSERVRSRLCSNLIFYCGTTETSTVSSAPAYALTSAAGAVGYVAPGVSVQIGDDAGTLLPEGREGLVRVRTPVSVGGHLDDPEQTELLFRDGYFSTGDIGYLTEDKLLFITGRKKEVLNLGGDKVSPQIIEEMITAFDGIRQAGAFTTPNELGIDEAWALIVHNGKLDEEALRNHCREKLAQIYVPVRFISVAGKITDAQGLSGSSL